MASPNAGGFVELSIDGVPYSIAGELEAEETNFAREAVTNQDGSVQATVKPKPYKFVLKLRDRQGRALVPTLFAAERMDVSAREVHMNRTTLLTGAFAVGTPKRNTATGEIDGVELVSDQIQHIDD